MVSIHIEAPTAALFVPGDRPERFAKAATSGAEAVILDLEDAVAPEHKDMARKHVAAHGLAGIPVMVRINARTTPWFEADLAALANASITAIMLPKAEDTADTAAVQARLGRSVPIVALIETARGLGHLAPLLAAPGVSLAAFGSLDFALDLGLEPSWEPLLMARSEIVLRSRLAGLPAPVDGVTTALDDLALVQAEAQRAAAMGFGGKLAVHPRQIAAIHRAFTPDSQTRAWAARVVEAAETAGATSVDGAMVDQPLVERARRILAVSARLRWVGSS